MMLHFHGFTVMKISLEYYFFKFEYWIFKNECKVYATVKNTTVGKEALYVGYNLVNMTIF